MPMKFTPLVAGLTLALAGVTALAQVEPRLSYKGAKLGAPLSEFETALPAFTCLGSSCSYSPQLCVNMGRMPESFGVTKMQACERSASFGGAEPVNASIQAKDGKVGQVILHFPKSSMGQLLESITRAYGAPVSTTEREVKNRFGMTSTSWEKTWKVGTDTLILREIASRIDEGAARLVTAEFLEQETKERAAKVSKGSKDF